MIYFALALIFFGLIFLWKAFQNSPKPRYVARNEVGPLASRPVQAPILRRPDYTLSQQARPKTQPLISQKSIRQEEVPQQELQTQLILDGVLYLDHEHHRHNSPISSYSKEQKSNYDSMQRIGKARLTAKADVFIIQNDNARYIYPSKELSQLWFQSSGVALIPRKPKQAAAIFLCQEAEVLKNHIKAHSHLHSQASTKT